MEFTFTAPNQQNEIFDYMLSQLKQLFFDINIMNLIILSILCILLTIICCHIGTRVVLKTIEQYKKEQKSKTLLDEIDSNKNNLYKDITDTK